MQLLSGCDTQRCEGDELRTFRRSRRCRHQAAAWSRPAPSSGVCTLHILCVAAHPIQHAPLDTRQARQPDEQRHAFLAAHGA